MVEQIYWIAKCSFSRIDASFEDSTILCDAIGIASHKIEFEDKLSEYCKENFLEVMWVDRIEKVIDLFARYGPVRTISNACKSTGNDRPIILGSFYDKPREQTEELLYTEIELQDIFIDHGNNVWALIDGVNCREIASIVEESKVKAMPLYSTANAEILSGSPWLIKVDLNNKIFSQWIKSLSALQHWGFLFKSSWNLLQLRNHLRKFTMIDIPSKFEVPVYFRFYDPRVFMDLTQILDETKLKKLCNGFLEVYLPISPMLNIPKRKSSHDPINVMADLDEFEGRFISYKPPCFSLEEVTNLTMAFKINNEEYQHLEKLQKPRSGIKLARELRKKYSENITNAQLVYAVNTAPNIGEEYGMKSHKEVTTLVRAIIEIGPDLLKTNSHVKKIISETSRYAWQRERALSKYLDNHIPNINLETDLKPDTVGNWIKDNTEKENNDHIS